VGAGRRRLGLRLARSSKDQAALLYLRERTQHTTLIGWIRDRSGLLRGASVWTRKYAQPQTALTWSFWVGTHPTLACWWWVDLVGFVGSNWRGGTHPSLYHPKKDAKQGSTCMKWVMFLLALVLTVLLLNIRPLTESYLRSVGLEKLESYIRNERLHPKSDVRLCDLLNIEFEPAVAKHFVCKVDLKEGTLYFDVAFTSIGGILYQDMEIGE
jgi:hypothetical protein